MCLLKIVVSLAMDNYRLSPWYFPSCASAEILREAVENPSQF
jgi:hypothetical protein